jgi:hypothetical protein
MEKVRKDEKKLTLELKSNNKRLDEFKDFD